MKNEGEETKTMLQKYSLFGFEPTEEEIDEALFGPPPQLDANALRAVRQSVHSEMETEQVQ